jgi:acetyl esterase
VDGRVYLLRGEPVVVAAVAASIKGTPRNVLLKLPGGGKTVRPFRGLRKPPFGVGRLGPHENIEIELMLAGKKECALLTLEQANWAKAVICEMGWPWEADRPFLLGDVAVATSQAALDRLLRAVANHVSPSRRDVWEPTLELGRVLGYTEADVQAFKLWTRWPKRRAPAA